MSLSLRSQKTAIDRTGQGGIPAPVKEVEGEFEATTIVG